MHEHKIPTIIGLILVFGAVLVFRLVFDQVAPLLIRASPTLMPKHVTFSNISDTSFAVSWTTDIPTTGAIIVDGNGVGTLYDERDETVSSTTTKPSLGSYSIHSVIVRNTKPQTTYHVRILSGGSLFQNGINPYTVTTGAAIPGMGINMEPAYGTVTLPNGQPAAGAIVYLTLDGGQVLSAFVTATGSWVIPLHLARTESLSAYVAAADRINESITIRAPQGEATATTDTLNDNPVPEMSIGKSYDFRKLQAENPEKQLAEAPPAVLGDSVVAANQTVAITQPAQNAHLSTNLPLFEGTGAVGKQVLILIGITELQSGVTTVGADGVWRFTPTQPLSDGRQSITITTKDSNNQTVALTHTFDVFKSGTQVLGDATPSATLTPTIIDTPTPTATLAGQPIPTTGNELPTLLLMLLGGAVFIGGSTLLFL